MSVEAAFEQIAAALLPEPGVDEGTGFGKNPGLRTGGKIFTMVVRDELVFKLPPDRAASLVASGAAHHLTVGKREMREWVCFPAAGEPAALLSLARAARDHVAA